MDPKYNAPQNGQPRPQYPVPDIDDAPPHHHYNQPQHKKKFHKKKVVILAIILVVAALSAGAYAMLFKPGAKVADSPKTINPQTNQNPSPATSPQPSSAANAQTSLKSTKLNLEVIKPAGWQGQEDPASGELTLTSSSVTYATASGASKTGVFVLKIRQGADTESTAAIHGSNAVQDSETIGYSMPTESQRHYTNLTIGGQGTNASFLLLTSTDQFKTGESLSRFFINGDVYVIAGGFRDASKTGLTGFDLMPKAAFLAQTQYQEAVTIVKSLKIF